ncbi:MAG: hypothetical protein PHQ09_01155 [Actinomycetota bacterium]|jgi:hypothetical protein|nr:hypothetical protein [Actinomycetota bacterium]
MNNINRYLKIVKNAVIQPYDDIDKKIINRISNISKLDEKLLDNKFLDYLKKNNSRVYLVIQKIKNNPGAFAVLAMAGIFIVVFIAFIFKIFLDEEKIGGNNHQLSSSKDDTQ